MTEKKATAANIELLGGRLSLDFANTADSHASEHPVEFLTNYAELVAWSQHVGILSQDQGDHLLRGAARHPSNARSVLRRTLALREAVYRIFSAVSHGQQPLEADLAALNDELSWALKRSRLALLEDGFAWQWAGEEHALDRMLWPVVRDAADLLTSGDLTRVGQCGDQECGWLFVDMSRNRSRRWCSMEYCGNRAKARRFYRRSKASQGDED